MLLLRRDSGKGYQRPGLAWRQPSDQELPERQAHDDDPWLCCRACRQKVTQGRFVLTIDGEREFVRTNPAGQTFRFHCFSKAQGAQVTGPASEEHSWFAGYRWQFTYCSQCHLQLGWYFSTADNNSPQAWFALIREQLMACGQAADGAGG